MKRLEHMKDSLLACVEGQICNNLHQVDTKELGEAIDMIKDLEEAIYYCTITKAMKENEEEDKQSSKHRLMMANGGGNEVHYYTPMYSDGQSYGNGSRTMYNDGMNYSSKEYQHMPMGSMRDSREGNSPIHRRMYMEGKQHKDQQKQMKELEDYMHELTNDIMEMIEDATPEEKQLLRQKIATLSTKIK